MSRSDAFSALVDSINALETEYIASPSAAPPSITEQERARAFLVFAHAEIEHYIERACRKAAEDLFAAIKRGRVTRATLSFVTFNSAQPLNGGDTLGSKKKAARQLATTLGQSVDTYLKLVESNEGIREKHLAKLLVPLGLNSNDVASTWLLDMDALATKRGQIAHMSRTDSAAAPLGFNPADVRLQVNRVLFAAPASTGRVMIESLEQLDEWITDVSSGARRVVRARNFPSPFWDRPLRLFRRFGLLR